MISLKPPHANYKSLEDLGKFNMIWNVSLALVPIFLFLTLLHIILGDRSWMTSITAFSVAAINLIVLYRTRKYKIVGTWSVLLGVFIVQASVFFVDDSHVVSDTMWCILIAFFTFFLFGAILGSLVLVVNLSGLTLFLMCGTEANILHKGLTVDQVDYKMAINVFYVALALSFVIYKMLDNNQKINNRYEQQIKENETLMKEIHHRVKNNLQIISSLLKLQSSESDSELVQEQFDEAIQRIRSMALIHEKMYQKEDLASIDVQSYLVSLGAEIAKSINSDCNIEINVESAIGQIDMESIVSVSLIFNELMTNSIKHGFDQIKEGKIDVKISEYDKTVQFYYSDSGEWKSPQKEISFGIELIETLTDQLEGTMARNIENGTQYVFEFPSHRIIGK